MYFIPQSSNYFINGLMELLEFAEEDVSKWGAKNICCPCVICENDVMYTFEPGELHKHLLATCFKSCYMKWTSHDEDGMSCEEAEHDEEQEWLMDGHAE